jgi:hypothetical protein
MNHGRRIRTLAEDFVELGLMSEEEALAEQAPAPDPAQARRVAQQQKKAQLKAAQQAKREAQKQARMQAMQAKRAAGSAAYEGSDDDDDLGLDDYMKMMGGEDHGGDTEDDLGEDDLDEQALKKIRRVRGAAAIKARRAARKYYKRFKGKIGRVRARVRKSPLGKKIARWFKKHKGRKGYRRAGPPGSSYYEGHDMMDQLGNTVDSLRFNNVSGQLAETFYNVVRLARATGENYAFLAEDYTSADVDYEVAAMACEAVALEAQEFAEALAEHDDSVGATDQNLLKERLTNLVEEASNLAEMCEVTKLLIDEANGDWNELSEEDDDDEEELEEMYAGEAGAGLASPYDQGYAPRHPPMAGKAGYEEYGEDPYRGPMALWKNDEVHIIGNVMHPLGWTQPEGVGGVGIRRLSATDKAVRNRQGGIGYGFHLGGESTGSTE